jgi:hypothetical protein
LGEVGGYAVLSVLLDNGQVSAARRAGCKEFPEMYDIKTLSWSAFNCCIDAERVPSLGSFMMISLEELAQEAVKSLPRKMRLLLAKTRVNMSNGIYIFGREVADSRGVDVQNVAWILGLSCWLPAVLYLLMSFYHIKSCNKLLQSNYIFIRTR